MGAALKLRGPRETVACSICARSHPYNALQRLSYAAVGQIFRALESMISREYLGVPIVGGAKAGWAVGQLQERARASLEEHGGGVDETAFTKGVTLLRSVDNRRAPARGARSRRG